MLLMGCCVVFLLGLLNAAFGGGRMLLMSMYDGGSNVPSLEMDSGNCADKGLMIGNAVVVDDVGRKVVVVVVFLMCFLF